MARPRTGLGSFEALPADSPLLRRRTPVGARRLTDAERIKRDFQAYAEASWSDAELTTRGNMLTPAGRRAGISPRQWFTGRRASTKYASDELKDWLRINGPTLSPSEYRAQIVDPPRAANPFLARSSDS